MRFFQMDAGNQITISAALNQPEQPAISPVDEPIVALSTRRGHAVQIVIFLTGCLQLSQARRSYFFGLRTLALSPLLFFASMLTLVLLGSRRCH